MNHWTIEAFLGEDAYNIDTDFLTPFVFCDPNYLSHVCLFEFKKNAYSTLSEGIVTLVIVELHKLKMMIRTTEWVVLVLSAVVVTNVNFISVKITLDKYTKGKCQ